MALQNQAAITQFLAGKGLTAAQIAGVEGNLQVESGGNPNAYNPAENAHGIAQWEGGRWTALQNFAAQSGGATNDLTTQLNFMWQEMQTTERGALSALTAATTPDQAATAVQSQYERSSAASLPARISAARSIFAGGVQGGSGQVQTGGGGVTAQPAGLTSSLWDGLLSALAPLGRLVVDGFVIVVGVVLVVVAVVLLAKAGANHDDTTTITLPGGGTETERTPRPKRHPIAAGAEDAAEAGAVAA